MSEETPPIELNSKLFIDGPADFLVRNIVDELLKVDQWKKLFTGGIDGYRREDYSLRGLPALRIYCENYKKSFDSWFIDGDVNLDIVLPASLRRFELEDVASQISAALLQQFRRNPFFLTLMDLLPGLNELGKEFSCDKSLGFNVEDNLVPLTQLKINFRIDLRMWDEYLTKTDRTKEDPFIRTLGNLERIHSLIVGMNDDLEKEEVVVQSDQAISIT